MGQTGQQTDTTSREQDFASEKISLEELFQKFQKKEIDHKIYLVRENPYDEDEERFSRLSLSLFPSLAERR